MINEVSSLTYEDKSSIIYFEISKTYIQVCSLSSLIFREDFSCFVYS